MAKRVKFKLNGKELETDEGRLVIDAAKDAGVEIPHYCYHPALGNPGNCRMCVVEVAGAPKPQVSCRLGAREGMDVKSDSDAAKRAQASALELHLVNHPLDCPVCDQSGECGLQDYYMKIGRYQSQVREDKQHKGKRIEAGPHVMLDQERCILCTRCTRFVDDVTKTHELGIFGRGHEERIEVTPGMTLDNAYSGNVVDICPVGALTDRDFRYKVRVWYLDKTDSVCPGCARGCNISVHTNTIRPWHTDGKRVARLKPRFNPEVNGHWICDDGRYGFANLDADRLGRVLRLSPQKQDVSWETAAGEIASRLREGIAKKGADGLAIVASGMLSNEDWTGLKALFVEELGASRFYFSAEPDQLGEEDELLRRKEKVPNLMGAQAHGLKSGSFDELAKDLEAGKIWGLYVVERDLTKVWGEARAKSLLSKCGLAVFQGPNKGGTGDLVHYRLPATAYVEEEGHFTNFQGKVQPYMKALDAIGEARPDWAIFDLVHKALSGVPA
ncbi:MAG TPA: 2Fe-2S iron-sulfur cluster-binding protein [Elusimicrobiota bacterium]|jgi:NADH-quinone oxidoreductase subunit G|nr:2Fe-2S iron-sulfur cluster-binding protein [Elusimicrobiota bacterium]